MHEVFEKIIENLEVEADSANDKIMEQETEKDMAYYDGYDDGCSKAIEIVKQEAEQYEECYKDCGECEAYDKEKYHCPKFCKVIKETVKEIEENHNGWIPCNDRLPEPIRPVLVTLRNWMNDKCFVRVGRFHTDHWKTDEGIVENSVVIAWQPLPKPYQPKGE